MNWPTLSKTGATALNKKIKPKESYPLKKCFNLSGSPFYNIKTNQSSLLKPYSLKTLSQNMHKKPNSINKQKAKLSTLLMDTP